MAVWNLIKNAALVAKVARWCQSFEFSISARLPPWACEEHVVLNVKIIDADLLMTEIFLRLYLSLVWVQCGTNWSTNEMCVE